MNNRCSIKINKVLTKSKADLLSIFAPIIPLKKVRLSLLNIYNF